MGTLAIHALTQILIMFFMIIAGVISYKVKLINRDTNKALSDIVLLLVNPLLIVISYQRDFNSTLLKGLLISLVMAVATHIFAIAASKYLVRGKKYQKNNAIERFAVIYSNCGFIGIPLVNGILGGEGVFYITAYMTIFNLFVWVHGVIMVTGKSDKKTVYKAFLSPSIISTVIGFGLFMLKINLPYVLKEPVSYIANMNTPLAMIVAGVTIAQTDIVKLVGKLRVYYITFLKLIFIPIVMLLIFSRFELPRMVLLTSVLAAGCPTATMVNLFAIKYDKDYLYASELFAVTTILSILSIPLVMTIADFLV